MALKLRRSVLIGVPMIALALILYALENQKKGDVSLPSKTVILTVAPDAEDAFKQSVRDYAMTNSMVITGTTSSVPGFLSMTLDGKRLHVNVSRTKPDNRRTTRIYFFAPKRVLGLGRDTAKEASADFIEAVTTTPGVSLLR